MSSNALAQWLSEHNQIFARLQRASVACDDAAERWRLDPSVGHLLSLKAAGQQLADTSRGAQQLQPIPEPDTGRHFAAALKHFHSAGMILSDDQTVEDRAEHVQRGAQQLEHGNDEIKQAAHALLAATHQIPHV
jgi:hypothetical protein